MAFQVPQFIEQKAKIIGPLTLPQFLYVAAAFGIGLAAYYLLSPLLWVLVSIIVGVIGISFAFVKINGQSLPQILQSAVSYWQRPKTYVWQRETPSTILDTSSVEKIEAVRRNMSLQQKVKSAVMKITTGSIPFLSGPKDRGSKQEEQYEVVRYLTGERGVAKRVDYSE